MNIVVAPDSFKECLPAKDVARSIELGVKTIFPQANISGIPVADGGEGTVDAFVYAAKGSIKKLRVHDALMREIDSFYGIIDDGATAVIEMAAASGLGLIKNQERNPFVTTTYGTGELIKDALDNGCNKIIIGIGGSATNDGGAGMAMALGGRFLDKSGSDIGFGGGALDRLRKIDLSGLDIRIKRTKIYVGCDVTNPLCGKNGASYVFGPQKGATQDMVEILDRNLWFFADIIERQIGISIAQISGAGASGGLGAGLLAFLSAVLMPGFEMVNKVTGLEDHIKKADLVFTAEGSIDFQTQFGKVISGVAQIAKKYDVPVIAFAGSVSNDIEILYEKGITSIFSIADKPMSFEESVRNAAFLLKNAAERVMRVIKNNNSGGIYYERIRKSPETS